MQNTTLILPENQTQNPEITRELAIPTAAELKNYGIEILNWVYSSSQNSVHHSMILEVPPTMLLKDFLVYLHLALDWNDLEFNCTGLTPLYLYNNLYQFSFTFEF